MALREMSETDVAYLKAGFYGLQGSGKTRTATELAIHLAQLIGSTKPITFVDTEGGVGYVLDLFREHGLRTLVDRTQAYKDLVADLREAEAKSDIAIVDSVTHFWRELVKAYKASRNARFLRIQDWGPLKDQWAVFTQLFLNSKLHIIMCGRSANIFEDVEEDDDEKPGDKSWKARRVGTKMAAEGESGYEPGLLVEFERIYYDEGGQYKRRATVIKDRFSVLDGRSFDFGPGDKPGYVLQCFLPYVKRLALGQAHGVTSDTSSEEIFDMRRGESFQAVQTRRDVALEEIEGMVLRYMPGTGPRERSLKAHIYKAAFGTNSMTAIRGWPPEQLRQILPLLEHLLRYVIAAEVANTVPEGDPSDVARWLEAERDAFLVRQADERKAAAEARQRPDETITAAVASDQSGTTADASTAPDKEETPGVSSADASSASDKDPADTSSASDKDNDRTKGKKKQVPQQQTLLPL